MAKITLASQDVIIAHAPYIIMHMTDQEFNEDVRDGPNLPFELYVKS